MTRPIKWRLKYDYEGWMVQYKSLWWCEIGDLISTTDAGRTLLADLSK